MTDAAGGGTTALEVGPQDFARAFAQAFGSQDSQALAAMMEAEAEVITPTGQLAEGREAIAAAWAAEFAGTFRAARLVTGRLRIRKLGPGASILSQRFVLSGAEDEAGNSLPRFAMHLSAVLLARPEGWRAVTLALQAYDAQ